MSDANQVKALSNELLKATKDYPNFVISSGCDTPPGVSKANVEAFFESINEYNNNAITSKQLTY
jgi:uroporphyrinogen decarboxylase